MTAKKITIDGFLDEFKNRHDQMEDRPFCWVLGSGASIQSGIPTGSALVERWLKELHRQEDFDKGPIETWATAENLGIPDFEYARAANFYPWVYHRRFRDYKEQGYAFLENAMDHAEPSFGYSVLAQIMAMTPHKVAVTTNFDNLIADALSIYTRIFPLVCGHESLTGYIRANLRRPLVAKIHRDLLLAPLSNPDEIAKLPGEWEIALKKILGRFTPIVIGYGGNDGSLMGFLKTLDPIEGGIFWCYREDREIDPKIHEVIDHHLGRLVPIAGFDEIMLQLQEKLQLPFLLPELQTVNDKRIADYQHQFETLTAALSKPGENAAAEEVRKPVRKAAEAAVERLTKEKNWWAWQLRAAAEPDLRKREAIYREGLLDFPKSADLMTYFADFLIRTKKNSFEAGELYRRAVDLEPNKATYISSLARFTEIELKDYDEAERLYRKASSLDSSKTFNSVNFARFMKTVRRDNDEAESLYRRAVEEEPTEAPNIGGLALFLHGIRKHFDEAERLYRQALQLDPKNSTINCNFAQLLATMDQTVEARKVSIRAWQLMDETASTGHAEVAFTLWLLERAAGRDGSPALGRLKTVVQDGFTRGLWSFDDLLATLLPRCPKREHSFARKLADAILDETRVEALDDEQLWTAVMPIPISVPWPLRRRKNKDSEP